MKIIADRSDVTSARTFDFFNKSTLEGTIVSSHRGSESKVTILTSEGIKVCSIRYKDSPFFRRVEGIKCYAKGALTDIDRGAATYLLRLANRAPRLVVQIHQYAMHKQVRSVVESSLGLVRGPHIEGCNYLVFG